MFQKAEMILLVPTRHTGRLIGYFHPMNTPYLKTKDTTKKRIARKAVKLIYPELYLCHLKWAENG